MLFDLGLPLVNALSAEALLALALGVPCRLLQRREGLLGWELGLCRLDERERSIEFASLQLLLDLQLLVCDAQTPGSLLAALLAIPCGPFQRIERGLAGELGARGLNHREHQVQLFVPELLLDLGAA